MALLLLCVVDLALPLPLPMPLLLSVGHIHLSFRSRDLEREPAASCRTLWGIDHTLPFTGLLGAFPHSAEAQRRAAVQSGSVLAPRNIRTLHGKVKQYYVIHCGGQDFGTE